MSTDHVALNGIARARADWLARLGAGDLDGYVGAMTAGVVWLPPRGPAMQGVAALRHWLTPFLARYGYNFSVAEVRLRVAGDWVFERGRYRSVLTPASEEESMVHEGRYALFWHRQPDGRWLIDRYADETQLDLS